ncbi:MAG: hypothetical protein M3548_03445 [Actinomycetota bacterium]|nr:hypothetical protein [Actinomycetota bacterium]
MDERKISDLFNDAVRDVPPPSFDRGDITAESARLTRKRNSVLAGSALGFALLVSGVAVTASVWTGGGSGNETAAGAAVSQADGNEQAAPYEVPTDGPGAMSDRSGGLGVSDLPSATPKQGGSSSGNAGTAGSIPSGCGTAARELAAALAGELPAATSGGAVIESPLSCPSGASSAAFAVENGPRKGLLSIMVLPRGADQILMPPWSDRPSGTTGAVVPTTSGKELVLVIEPVFGSAAPPIDEPTLKTMAAAVARRL